MVYHFNAHAEHSPRLMEPMDPLVPSQTVVSPPSSPTLNPERWVDDYGDLLFAFAAARVRDHAVAQDLVQETFLAALKASRTFAGRSSERSWLFGILRNKLIDHYRRQSRETAIADLEPVFPEEQGAFGTKGPGKDGWILKMAPKVWETPEDQLVSKEFQKALKTCLAGLPEKVAQVFSLREIDGLASEQICKDLRLSPNNLWVILHRARIGLRRCLETNWFGKQKNK